MIKILENTITTVSVYNSNFDLSSTSFTLKLTHDLNCKSYDINYSNLVVNTMYGKLDFLAGTGGIVLKDLGFYTLQFKNGNTVLYTERCQFIKDDKNFIDKNKIKFYKKTN